jgi:pimeloyl-ACP methyl ester carboxylesterase
MDLRAPALRTTAVVLAACQFVSACTGPAADDDAVDVPGPVRTVPAQDAPTPDDAIPAATSPDDRGTSADDVASPQAPQGDPDGSGPDAPPSDGAAAPAPVRLDVSPLVDPVTTDGFQPYAAENAEAWVQEVPEAQPIAIESTQDGVAQPAYWVAPTVPGQPLLVVLHSWSTPFDQQLSIPYARWAADNGWGLIAPDFRGVNERPQSTGSDLAVADVIDAVDFAVADGGADPERVFVVGFSGGGMMALLMAGRHPDRFAAAISWVPIHDLPRWYAYNASLTPQRSYVQQIEDSCGGAPNPGTAAERECRRRSPSAWLDDARQAGIPIYIGAGLDDDIVPATDAGLAFNQLADPDDRLSDAQLGQLTARQLDGRSLDPRATSFLSPQGPQPLLTRRSGATTLVVFDGAHEMLYGAGIDWLARGLPAARSG